VIESCSILSYTMSHASLREWIFHSLHGYSVNRRLMHWIMGR